MSKKDMTVAKSGGGRPHYNEVSITEKSFTTPDGTKAKETNYTREYQQPGQTTVVKERSRSIGNDNGRSGMQQQKTVERVTTQTGPNVTREWRTTTAKSSSKKSSK